MLSFFGLITLPIFFMFLSGGLLRTVENAALACQLASKGEFSRAFPNASFLETPMKYMNDFFRYIFGAKPSFNTTHILLFSIVLAILYLAAQQTSPRRVEVAEKEKED